MFYTFYGILTSADLPTFRVSPQLGTGSKRGPSGRGAMDVEHGVRVLAERPAEDFEPTEEEVDGTGPLRSTKTELFNHV